MAPDAESRLRPTTKGCLPKWMDGIGPGSMIAEAVAGISPSHPAAGAALVHGLPDSTAQPLRRGFPRTVILSYKEVLL